MANETASGATNLTANAFTRTGYSFAGWNTVATGGGTSYANGASYPFTASTTLYAQWTLTPDTLTAVGNFASNGGKALTTTSASLAQPGDLLVIWVKDRFASSTQIHVTNISRSGTGAIGTPVNAIQYYTVDHPNNDVEIWYAPVTTAGTITLTFTWSGNNSSDFLEYSTQEFQPSTPSTYSLDTTGHYESNTDTLTMQFPSLTPVGAGELYAGYNSNDTSGVYTTSTTPGYTQDVTSDQDVILIDPDVSASTQSPFTTAASQPSTQSSIGALVVATPASQYTVTFSGNGSTGGSMANETASGATNLTANAFTKTGYSFAGWNTVATGGGTSYANGASYPFTASTTLYAQWTQSTGAIALVSGSTSSTKVGTTGAIAVTSAQNVASSANVLLVMVQVFGPNSSGEGAISDTGTGTWTALGETTVSGDTQFVLWQCTNPQAGVKHVVTWTPSAADNWGSLVVMAEWAGGPFTLDKMLSVLTAKGTVGATPSVTPSTAGELILGSAADENGTSAWTSPTNSFTALATPDSANVMAYLVDSATSPTSTTWSVNPSDSGITAIFALS
jgi:hypothetical protein